MSRKMVEKEPTKPRQKLPSSTEREENPEMLADETKNQLAQLDTVLSSPVARKPRQCSTPIRSTHETYGGGEYSPDRDYRGSPTMPFPCTQESVNEIAWDWHGGSNKWRDNISDSFKNKNSGAFVNTPKKTSLAQKKRTAQSYSPLLNKPPKRKLIRNEMGEGIGQLATELQALTEQLKTNQRNKLNGDAMQLPENEDSSENGIFEMATQVMNEESFFLESSSVMEKCNSTDKLASIEKSTSVEKLSFKKSSKLFEQKIAADQSSTKRDCKQGVSTKENDLSLEDFFDDSIDDCMVKCSQDIEEKLRLGSFEYDVEKTSVSSHRGQPKTDKSTEKERRGEAEERTSKTTSHDLPASQIPDDSFDDFLAIVLDKEEESLGTALTDQRMGSSIGHSWKNQSDRSSDKSNEDIGEQKISRSGDGHFGITYKKIDSTSIARPTNSFVNEVSVKTSSNFKRKNSTEIDPSQSRKFFKSKSLSDSHCVKNALETEHIRGRDDVYAAPISKSVSNHNLAAGSKSEANKNRSDNDKHASNQITYSYRRDTGATNAKSDCVPAGSNFLQSQYTPAEIERKRLEAKMKLEAKKMKNQGCIKKSYPSTVKQLVKR